MSLPLKQLPLEIALMLDEEHDLFVPTSLTISPWCAEQRPDTPASLASAA